MPKSCRGLVEKSSRKVALGVLVAVPDCLLKKTAGSLNRFVFEEYCSYLCIVKTKEDCISLFSFFIHKIRLLLVNWLVK